MFSYPSSGGYELVQMMGHSICFDADLKEITPYFTKYSPFSLLNNNSVSSEHLSPGYYCNLDVKS